MGEPRLLAELLAAGARNAAYYDIQRAREQHRAAIREQWAVLDALWVYDWCGPLFRRTRREAAGAPADEPI